MSKYKLIIEYYLKGNNRTQIATLCDCSRMTVWRVLQRVNAIGIGLDELSGMSEKELAYLLFPERAKAGDGYQIPILSGKSFRWLSIVRQSGFAGEGIANARQSRILRHTVGKFF